MSQATSNGWPDDSGRDNDPGPIPPDLMDPPSDAPDPIVAVDEAFDTADDGGVALKVAIHLLAESEPERWRVRTDDDAEWALRHLAESEAELDALRQRAHQWQEKIQAWFEHAAKRTARSSEFWTEHLAWYSRNQRAETGRKSIVLPSGEVSTRLVNDAVEIIDSDALLRWATENCPEIIRHREDVQVSTLRKHVEFDDFDRVHHRRTDEETGETSLERVPGVSLRPGSISTTVKVNP